jgi:hypothetical protein
LQPGEVVVAEKIDRLSRLPLAEAEQMVNSIRGKCAKLAVPGLVDLSEIAAAADGAAKIVLESLQALLLKLALQMARAAGKYGGRVPDITTHQRIGALPSLVGTSGEPQS